MFGATQNLILAEFHLPAPAPVRTLSTKGRVSKANQAEEALPFLLPTTNLTKHINQLNHHVKYIICIIAYQKQTQKKRYSQHLSISSYQQTQPSILIETSLDTKICPIVVHYQNWHINCIFFFSPKNYMHLVSKRFLSQVCGLFHALVLLTACGCFLLPLHLALGIGGYTNHLFWPHMTLTTGSAHQQSSPLFGQCWSFCSCWQLHSCTSIAFSAYKRSFCALKVPIPLALSQQSLYIKTAFPAQDST